MSISNQMNRSLIRRLFRKILYWAIPELKMLRDHSFHFEWLKNNLDNSEIEPSVKLYSPYDISDSRIGRYTYIAKNSHIDATTIGSFCSIGPNLVCGWGIHPTNLVSTHPMFYSTRKQNGTSFSLVDKIEERRPIQIGNDVFIGANVTILDGVTIGDGAIIGAGAVVSKDIPPFAIAVGCPIQIKRYRFSEKIRMALQEIKWWDFSEQQLRLVEQYAEDIDGFIKNCT